MAEEKVYTISQVTNGIKGILENNKHLQNIWLKGEISNLSKQFNGNIYFSLKDEFSQISCTFLKWVNKEEVELQDGMMLLALGSISVYAPHGKYQLTVKSVKELGLGDIKLELEKLKKKLYLEGLFLPEKKKPLPFYPLTIGVASSPTGAALRDIVRVARKRNPIINIILAPCQVQGKNSPGSIINALKELQKKELHVDVIICGRGGGSFEDLLAFSDENVVREIAACKIPIVSAVGHEIDHPISDEAADRSAPTPSAAAELVVPEYEPLKNYIEDMEYRNKKAIQLIISKAKQEVHNLLQRPKFKEPLRFFSDTSQKLDDLNRRFILAADNYLDNRKNILAYYEKLTPLFKQTLTNKKNSYNLLSAKLDNFSPLGTLKRGYSICRNPKTGKVIKSAKQLKVKQKFEIILSDGSIQAEVLELE